MIRRYRFYRKRMRIWPSLTRAWLLAILKTSHVSHAVHERYDVAMRESRRKFDSWSADALAEVIAANEEVSGG